MSYSGYREFLCANGHYERVSCWGDDPKECHFCGAGIAHRNSVDTTNGVNKDDPWTMPAPKKEIGWDDKWFEDHYGNRYATKVLRYAPGSVWKARASRVLAKDNT